MPMLPKSTLAITSTCDGRPMLTGRNHPDDDIQITDCPPGYSRTLTMTEIFNAGGPSIGHCKLHFARCGKPLVFTYAEARRIVGLA